MTHRILMVGDSYPPLIGGATRAVQLLGKELTARGHSVSVATPWQPGLALEEDDDGVAVHRIKGLASRVTIFSADPARRHHPPFPDVMTTVSLRRILNAFRPDIVHAFGWMTYSCATALIGTGIPLILSARDYSNVCAVRTLIQASDEGERICEGPSPAKCIACASREYGVLKGVAAVGGVLAGRPLLRSKISALHSCSYYIEDVMNRFLLDGPHLASSSHAPLRAVIPDFREDVSGAAVDRDLLSQLPDTPFILFVGALRLCKGLEPLFEAYGRLTDPPPLILMGTRNTDTPSNFPSGVHVFYSVPHPTVMAAWDRSLFGVAPSILPEPLGNVVHEAMSRGKPVIGTYPGGMGDMIVDGESGLLVPAGDVTSLAGAMELLLGDPCLRDRLGSRAREHAARFTAAEVLPQIEQLYHDVLAQHRRAA